MSAIGLEGIGTPSNPGKNLNILGEVRLAVYVVRVRYMVHC